MHCAPPIATRVGALACLALAQLAPACGGAAEGDSDGGSVIDAADGNASDSGEPAADASGPDAALSPAEPCPMTSGRVWPTEHGDACISPWQDDKLAAISITIDDNTAPDHDWWIAQGNAHGFRFTWFVITERPDTGDYWGTWDDFAALYAMGHDVQSHTVTHLDGTLTIEEEYGDSQQAIEEHIPGIEVLTLAYPGGDNSYLNDPAVAAQYYVGARGTTGHHNPIDAIDYMNVNSISSFNYATDHWASIANLTVYDAAHASSFMAWQCMHFHQISAISDEVAAGLDYITAHEDDLWLGLFREVVLYGRERDSAELSSYVAADEILIHITDDLDDEIFSFPLTVKVRLSDEWTAASATQSGEPVPVTLLDHDGATYALVPVRPDRGDMRLLRED